MTQQLIFRNDDVSVTTTVPELQRVHALFLKHKVMHTVALICKDLDKTPELCQYLRECPLFNVQLHCWEHVDLTQLATLGKHIKWSLEMMRKCGLGRATVLFPPWNKSDARVVREAAVFGLQVSNDKMSLSGYLKGQQSQVINFHYWAPECADLEKALVKYKETQATLTMLDVTSEISKINKA